MTLKINKIVHEYPNFKLNISTLNIKENNIIGLIGENGAGKTTFMDLLSGLKKANVSFEVTDLDSNSILYIPSDLEPFDYMTVIEFIDIIRKYSKVSKTNLDILKELNLEEKRNVLISELSQGMRKKLSLINVFLHDYKLIVLDEPFNSVDIKYIYQLKKLLSELKKKSIIIVSSHILDTLSDLCDEFIYLEDGKVKKRFKNSGEVDLLERELFE
ncbi:ATP-binding cassette domain-containing protein [Streptococcus ratti]|uniref:Abc1 n=2 Tax=Streptococcus ratti TaxID=1341 RepID=Q3YB72_STRRT|nr:ATP-binding cassette domain-containing protein [Streptococcus ratti]VEI60897.1 Abc1 [Streptococcus mutans]AAZ76606.1 Abc1 [Streptococcus ratti]EJN94626.1 ribose/galactoside ABC transporter ATP-binding protein [Streptococcus ratti FA-1 = DSM 20564]EMP71404.1 ribose/galactoside ABC transporter ATP-binding protein [Streptococcus ratti FA-1 = DSM 20564]QEY06553.1 ATP-binding cassette domain-containing protein [Streptococcus ratti]